MDVHTFFVILHLFGVAIGAGGAFMTDIIFLSSIKDYIFSPTEIRIIKRMSVAVWSGLILLVSSGIGLFALDPEGYLDSSKFILKMSIVVVLIINGAFFHFKIFPLLKSITNIPTHESDLFKNSRVFLIITGSVSVVSWSCAIVLGALRSLPVSLTLGAVIYVTAVLCGVIVGLLFSRKYASPQK